VVVPLRQGVQGMKGGEQRIVVEVAETDPGEERIVAVADEIDPEEAAETDPSVEDQGVASSC